MKRIALLAFATLLLLASCAKAPDNNVPSDMLGTTTANPGTEAEEIYTEEVVVNPGVVTGGVYTNESFGLPLCLR